MCACILTTALIASRWRIHHDVFAGQWASQQQLSATPAAREEQTPHSRPCGHTVCREQYNLTHARQLELYTSRKTFQPSRDRVYCKDIHGDGCKQCASCHFCRQKVVTELTSCSKWVLRECIISGSLS